MGLVVDSYLQPASKSRETKTRKKSKIRPDERQVLLPNLRIRGHLPAPIINWGEDSI